MSDTDWLDDLAARRSNAPQTLGYLRPGAPHILACERRPVAEVLHKLGPKIKWLQQFATSTDPAMRDCCRDPIRNMDIEAWYSGPHIRESEFGPDIYKFYCRECSAVGDSEWPTCHVKWCVGVDHPDYKHFKYEERPELFEIRPMW